LAKKGIYVADALIDRLQSRFPYTTVEVALAEVLNIPEEGRKAFRARMRHIRNLGIPRDLDRPGSGKKLYYSLSQVLETALVLVLENAGFTPRVAVSMAPTAVLSLITLPVHAEGRIDLGDLYIVVLRAGSGTSYSRDTITAGGWLNTFLKSEWFLSVGSYEELTKRLPGWLECSDTASLLNMSHLMRKVEKALAKGL
jgi:hypothetical protein